MRSNQNVKLMEMLFTTDQGAFRGRKMQGEMLGIISNFFQENSKVFHKKIILFKGRERHRKKNHFSHTNFFVSLN